MNAEVVGVKEDGGEGLLLFLFLALLGAVLGKEDGMIPLLLLLLFDFVVALLLLPDGVFVASGSGSIASFVVVPLGGCRLTRLRK